MAVVGMTNVVVVLTLAFPVAQGAPVVTTRCEAPAVRRGETGHVTCDYGTDDLPRSYSLELFPATNPDIIDEVVECLVIDNVSSCKISPGYSHNKTFGRQVVFQFQNASEDNEGHYVCQIIPSKGESSVNHCQFQLNVTTTCEAPAVRRGETGHVTCDYGTDDLPRSYSLELFPATNPDIIDEVVGCHVIDNVSSCKISPGYSHNKTFGRQVVFQFQNASEDNEGHYVCQIIPRIGNGSIIPRIGNGSANHCQFQLNATGDSKPKKSAGFSFWWIVVAVLGFLTLVVIVVTICLQRKGLLPCTNKKQGRQHTRTENSDHSGTDGEAEDTANTSNMRLIQQNAPDSDHSGTDSEAEDTANTSNVQLIQQKNAPDSIRASIENLNEEKPVKRSRFLLEDKPQGTSSSMAKLTADPASTGRYSGPNTGQFTMKPEGRTTGEDSRNRPEKADSTALQSDHEPDNGVTPAQGTSHARDTEHGRVGGEDKDRKENTKEAGDEENAKGKGDGRGRRGERKTSADGDDAKVAGENIENKEPEARGRRAEETDKEGRGGKREGKAVDKDRERIEEDNKKRSV